MKHFLTGICVGIYVLSVGTPTLYSQLPPLIVQSTYKNLFSTNPRDSNAAIRLLESLQSLGDLNDSNGNTLLHILSANTGARSLNIYEYVRARLHEIPYSLNNQGLSPYTIAHLTTQSKEGLLLMHWLSVDFYQAKKEHSFASKH